MLENAASNGTKIPKSPSAGSPPTDPFRAAALTGAVETIIANSEGRVG